MRSRMILDGALRIQRLEGSRPDVELCTLNGTARVRSVHEDAQIGLVCEVAGGIGRRRIAMRQPPRVEGAVVRASPGR